MLNYKIQVRCRRQSAIKRAQKGAIRLYVLVLHPDWQSNKAIGRATVRHNETIRSTGRVLVTAVVAVRAGRPKTCVHSHSTAHSLAHWPGITDTV